MPSRRGPRSLAKGEPTNTRTFECCRIREPPDTNRGSRNMANTFNIRIEGNDSTPDAIRLRDLFDVLLALETAAAAAAEADSGRAPEQHTDFHLIGIASGSTGCAIATGPSGFTGINLCASAIARNDISVLPERSRDALIAVWTKTRNREWTVRVAGENGMPIATISRDSEFVEAQLEGGSTISGKILRVGGCQIQPSKSS